MPRIEYDVTMIAPDKMNWVLRFILDSMGVDTA